MTKNKRISFIVLFSVFIAVLFGFGTNFVSSNATNTDNTQPTIKSYYSDENGEKIDKTEYTDDESIYSTIELSIPTSKLKYSKITVMDKSINGIQMVLKKVVDDQGNDITNEFGYENKKYNDENYSGVYTNSPNLDKNDFYNHTYKLIFEEYLSDTDLFVKNADVNGYYNLEHEYQAVFETSDGSNSVISDKITSKIKVTEAVNYSMISADEKANGKTFKPGDTITYTTTISEDVKTQKASDLTFEYEGLGLYDKNSVKVIDSNKKDINFEATQTTQNNLKIVFKDDLTYENPFTLVFKVKVPTNIKENKDFKGYLTTNLNIIGYGKTEEDDELKVTIDNLGGNYLTIKASKQNIVLWNCKIGDSSFHIRACQRVVLALIRGNYAQFNIALFAQFSDIFFGNLRIISVIHMEGQNAQSPLISQISQIRGI